ncbi:Chitin synthase 4 [Basidiobolus ranarum]|uniref:chitin synthase n=1 Tax=Basidiobolus ranarum TaxID=34480 RepID=A0ABR2WW97_9FUNG
MLVTCYSEGEQGLRTTLDSLTLTDYPSSHKLILVIADGVITGYGNDKSTPEICLSMMKDFVIAPELVQPMSYIAIADGTKRHNMSKIYAGYYKFDETTVPAERQPRVPMILISKCGNQEEANLPKPGNRGKRDSQIILMSFLQHVMFDERMTEMEYELFNAIWGVTGVSPDNFEIVLMVDADTKVYPDSVTRMVSCMVRDPQIMGLCGETKIATNRESWVTMIQVFEYYISHHLSKAFESVFGGVTCLPGCFCMYRIKAPKGTSGLWVPVLASPDIVEHYSENVVDTLHKKNLLLLGEDRFLTTLMLRTFPKRKMIFVPQAVCKTVVPDTFSILLSQRRRWINSTVHNLLELVLIRDLCGTFCFSMQFVVFLELLGTVVLPAAICFTLYLIIVSFLTTPAPIIPLILLAVILGLPAILILMTTRKVVYVGWMLIYLLSLFVWNFLLPVYAFWHFDDFSWGQTRQVEGEKEGEGGHGEKEGEFDASRITMKKWSEFERNKRRKTNLALNKVPGLNLSSSSLDQLGYHTPSQLARLSSVNLGTNPRTTLSDSENETSSNAEQPR